MKKLLIIILALVTVFCAVACTDNNDVSDNTSKNDFSEKASSNICNKAKAPIEKGDAEGAYKLLYSSEQTDEIRAMIDDFKIIATREVYKYAGSSFDSVVADRTFDSKGNVLTDNTSSKKYEYTYDDKNRVVFEKHIYSNGEVTISYAYDDEGRVIKIENNDPRQKYHYIEEREYDKYGNETKRTRKYDGITDVSEHKYTYDEKGNIIKDEYPDDVFAPVIEYVYDDSNRVIERKVGVDKYLFVYDEKGNLLSETYDSYHDMNEYRNEFTYDINDNKTKEIYTEDGKTVETYEREFDSASRLLKEVHIKYGRETEKETTTFEYNEKGLLITKKTTRVDTETVQYSYDNLGNLTEIKNSTQLSNVQSFYTYSGYRYFYCPEE